jgi:hypothetical protein
MITNKYIKEFEKTETYVTIAAGFLTGNYSDTILGVGAFSINPHYVNSMERTVPSQVIITAHILVQEKQLDPAVFEDFFRNVNCTEENVCLLLRYISLFERYQEDHSTLIIDLITSFLHIKSNLANLEVNCLPLLNELTLKYD